MFIFCMVTCPVTHLKAITLEQFCTNFPHDYYTTQHCTGKYNWKAKACFSLKSHFVFNENDILPKQQTNQVMQLMCTENYDTVKTCLENF
jgi:hypothetical protein